MADQEKDNLNIEQTAEKVVEALDAAEKAAKEGVAQARENNAATADSAETEVEEEEPSLDVLKKQLVEAQAKAQENWDTVLRLQAEQDNLHKRMTRDVENAHKYALEKFAQELLPIKDSLEMAVEAGSKPETTVDTLREGSELMVKMLASALEKFKVTEINPVGKKFDPHLHEAMSMTPDPNVEPNTVVMVHQKGYQLNDRLLRPARVIVAKAVE
jgi:molecular chaperone GrpE